MLKNFVWEARCVLAPLGRQDAVCRSARLEAVERDAVCLYVLGAADLRDAVRLLGQMLAEGDSCRCWSVAVGLWDAAHPLVDPAVDVASRYWSVAVGLRGVAHWSVDLAAGVTCLCWSVDADPAVVVCLLEKILALVDASQRWSVVVSCRCGSEASVLLGPVRWGAVRLLEKTLDLGVACQCGSEVAVHLHLWMDDSCQRWLGVVACQCWSEVVVWKRRPWGVAAVCFLRCLVHSSLGSVAAGCVCLCVGGHRPQQQGVWKCVLVLAAAEKGVVVAASRVRLWLLDTQERS